MKVIVKMKILDYTFSYLLKSLQVIHLGRVVRKPVNANQELKVVEVIIFLV